MKLAWHFPPAAVFGVCLLLLAVISPGQGKELDRRPLPSGASLIFRETMVKGEGGYELVYAPANAAERSIWSFPNQRGTLYLVPIVSAYEGDGKVSVLFYHGSSAKDILLIRATTTPPSPAPATVSIVGGVDFHGNPTIGQAKLVDHDHNDLAHPDGTIKHLTIDSTTYMAKQDGVPVRTLLLKDDSNLVSNPQINGQDFFEGKLDAALRAIGERARGEDPKPDSAGPAKTIQEQRLPSGANLIFRRTPVQDESMYELVYARPNETPTTIWSVPSNHGILEMSPVMSAFEGDGMVTALFYCGADVMFVQVPINPALRKPRALQLGQISSGSGFEEAKTLRLLDHHRFDATSAKGKTNHVVVDTKTYTATMDGKPVRVLLYTNHPVVLPDDALVTPDDVFDGKVDESAIPVRTPPGAAVGALPIRSDRGR